jgi:hypothetical protein
MEDIYRNNLNLSKTDRINLGFALGKVFEELKEYKKSFDFILEANTLQRKLYTYSIQDDKDLFERIKKTFSSDFFSLHFNSGIKDKTPIFIFGMPRSGTTLVEQIISSHPEVYGAGELDILFNLANCIYEKDSAKKIPEQFLDLKVDEFNNLGSKFIKAIRKYSKDAQYITEKTPLNFLYVGLIKAILPNA